MNLKPSDFWQLTFGEFWPIFNAITGQVIRPLSLMEMESLDERWTKRGNT